MDKQTAQAILDMMETDMANGTVSFQSSEVLKAACNDAGEDYLKYLYMKDTRLVFNVKRWKRDFLGESV
jgi:hypothetical protein